MRLIIKEDIRDTMREATLLAGWPGMGQVGLGAIHYLRTHLDALPFAEVDSSEYFTPEEVVVDDGLVKFPDMPSNTFYYCRNPDIVIFESEAQIQGTGGINMMNKILDLAEQLNIRTFFTGAAFAMPISHKESVRVFGVANQKSLRDSLIPHGVEIMDKGQISGLNGLLLGFAGLRDIQAACLLATMPHYAMQMHNPKASREIVQVLRKLLRIDVDMREIDRTAHQMDESMAKIEDQMQNIFSNQMQNIFSKQKAAEDEEGWKKVEDDRVPEYVMQRIDRLFRAVQSDRSTDKAAELKKELDRWNLYNLYEDRFLELFR